MSTKRKLGRPSRCTKGTTTAICMRLALGESLRGICRDPDMPGLRTVMTWLLMHDEFRQQYARARELQAELLADELIEIADDARNDWMQRLGEDGTPVGWKLNGEHVQRSRLRIDARKWIAARLLPKKYGNRVQANVQAGVEFSVAEEIERARARARAVKQRRSPNPSDQSG